MFNNIKRSIKGSIPINKGVVVAADGVSIYFQQSAQLSLCVTLCPADSLLYPAVYVQVIHFAELLNLKSLVLNRLLVGTYANVTVGHSNYFFLFPMISSIHILAKQKAS